ncbi:ABC transporter G family member 23-like isoform X3 [Lycorma delicatula]
MELQYTQPMVAVYGAFKRYSSNTAPLLKGYSMTVPTGTIYGLLGPSGCGKTTLLNCIAGCRKLDSGEIKLGIRKRHELGYMPQDVALYEEFTIAEIFQFYGRIFNMSKNKINERMIELLKFFELPLSGTISKLSGGQQRRVSFAVALLHNPKLLILDEPTVGVDPVLCSKIWEVLIKMSVEEKKTIIITTHYIEEARQCQLIGMMRSGILLAEDSPMTLMTAHNCSTLEQVFLELSQKQQEAVNRNNCDTDYPPFNKLHYIPPLISSQAWNVNRFIAQLQKNVYWLKRNFPILVFLLLLPLLLFSIYCSTFGKKPIGLPFGVVTYEVDNIRDCGNNFTTSSFVEIASRLDCYVTQPLSCLYLEYMQKEDVKLIEYQSVDDAQIALSKNKVWGVLHFSKNFTSSLLERIDMGWVSDDTVINFSIVDVWMDMSNSIIGETLKRLIIKSYDQFIGDVFEYCGGIPSSGRIPIKMNDAVYGGNDPVFMHSTLPGYVLSFGFYLSMMFTSGALLLEKLYGHLERKLVAGMTMLEIVLAHTVVQFILMICQTAIILWTAYGLFYNPMEGNPYLVVLLLLLVEIAGMCYGFLLSEIYDSDRNCSYAGIGTVLALFLTTGVLWPVEGAHQIMKSVMWALPVNAATSTYQSVSLKGFKFYHPIVYKGFMSVTFWILLFSVTAFIINRIRRN